MNFIIKLVESQKFRTIVYGIIPLLLVANLIRNAIINNDHEALSRYSAFITFLTFLYFSFEKVLVNRKINNIRNIMISIEIDKLKGKKSKITGITEESAKKYLIDNEETELTLTKFELFYLSISFGIHFYAKDIILFFNQ